MQSPGRFSLGGKLRLAVFLTSGVALLLAAVVYVAYQGFALYAETVRDLSETAQGIAASSARAVDDGDAATLQRLIEFAGAQRDVSVAAIYAADGRLLVANRPGEDVAARLAVQEGSAPQFTPQALTLVRPIVQDGRQVGSVYLRSGLGRFYRRLTGDVLVGATVVVAAFGLALLVVLRLQKKIESPIQELLRVARAASQDENYTLRVKKMENGELGELVDSFNAILKKIQLSTSALRTSNQYFLSLVERGPYGIIILDRYGTIKFINRVAETELGYSARELLNNPLKDLLADDANRSLQQVLERPAMDAAEGCSLEVSLRHKQGSARLYELGVTNLLDDPNVSGIVLVLRDVTDKKRAEDESRRTQHFLDTVFENNPDMIFVKDAQQFRYVRVNRAFEELLGHGRAEVIGKTDYDLFPKEQADFFRAKDRETLSSGESVDIQEEAVDTRTGTRRIVRTKKLPIAQEDGTPRYLLGIAEDITEWKAAVRALAVSEERYRTVVEHAADAFFTHDLHGRFIEVNRLACDSLGYSREELLQMSVPDIEMNYDTEHVAVVWKEMKPGVPHTINGMHRRKDGTTFPVEVRLTRVPLGQEDRIIALVRDVTVHKKVHEELRQAKEVAEAANRVKTEFLANVSHEIRTPMNAVIGMTDLMLQTELTQKQRAYVATIRSSGDMLLSVIDDILDFSKLEAGELILENVAFDLADTLESTLELLGHRAYDKNIELACAVSANMPTQLSGDPYRLRQVLVNLAGNAVKFTDKGQVVIEAERVSETGDEISLRFVIRDTGIGISPGVRERLFSPFSQLDTSTTRRYGGTGLGLAISKRLVEKMGGRIGVESEPGRGSSFWFIVRFQKQPGQEPRADTIPIGQRVLIVDDNPTLRDIMARYAKAWGMDCAAAGGTDEALRKLKEAAAQADPYAAAVIDVEMPATDGVSLARRIQADPMISGTRLVLLAPIARPLEVGLVSTLQNATCINKPVLPRALRDSLLQESTQPPKAVTGLRAVAPPRLVPDKHAAASGQGPRVLVAEDNPVSNELLLDMLDTLGYAASAVADGRAVLDALEKTSYELILLDCQMPGMDGYEVAAELRRRDDRGQRPVIIAVTANASVDDQQRCLKAGMDDYLPKPVRLEQLRRMMDAWIPAGPKPKPKTATGSTQTVPGPEAKLDKEIWGTLRLRAQDDPTFINKLVDLFISDARERLTTLSEALTEGQAETVARAAHALKAGCLQVGAQRMAQFCETLQRAGRSERLDEAQATFDRLVEEFDRVCELLEEEKASAA